MDKPAGITSHDVVAVTRRALRTRRVGHTGTLDPFATGLLVLLVGHATRLAQFVEGEPKTYEAEIIFGAETETDDATGAVIREGPLPDPAAVAAGLAALSGELSQVPPAYSAKQVKGIRAYAAARKGEPLGLDAVRVTVHSWAVLKQTAGALTARIVCGGGTYIRALARDLGRLCGSAAHLRALRRTGSGPFTVDEACAMDRVREGRVTLLPMRSAIPSMPARTLDEAERVRVRNGGAVQARGGEPRVALVDETGSLLAIAELRDHLLQPRLVLADG